MKKTEWKHSLILLVAALIWGSAFVAQSMGMDYIQPFTFTAIRSLVGSLFLLLFMVVSTGAQRSILGAAQWEKLKQEEKKIHSTRDLIRVGTLCGCLLFAATNLQQFGMLYTSVGKSGFITALYIILVPVFGLFLHRRPGKKMWLAVGFAIVGLYLLCMKSGAMSLETGDLLLLLCAIAFSFHIIAVDCLGGLVNGIKLSCVQFLVCGILSSVGMMIFEQPQMEMILMAWGPILYAGVLSSGVAYTLQIVGQKGLNPVVASLIMSLESVISVLSGWLVLGQKLTIRESVGCVVMFLAIILAQLPDREKIAR